MAETEKPESLPVAAKNRGGAPIGNRNGAKARLAAAALREAVDAADKARNCKYKLDLIVRKLLRMAADGDIEAIKIVFDRLDGKALATLDITHNKGPTLLQPQQARELAESFLEARRISDAAGATYVADLAIERARSGGEA